VRGLALLAAAVASYLGWRKWKCGTPAPTVAPTSTAPPASYTNRIPSYAATVKPLLIVGYATKEQAEAAALAQYGLSSGGAVQNDSGGWVPVMWSPTDLQKAMADSISFVPRSTK
jgi:hypothetical protein